MVIRPHSLGVPAALCALALTGSGALAQSFAGIGTLPGESRSSAYAISADGSSVVGSSGNVAFLWTAAAGMIPLGTLPGGGTSEALGVNADGTAIVGYAITPEGVRAFRWTGLHGMVALSTPTTPQSTSTAYDLSNDGFLAIGSGFTSNGGFQAYRWTNLAGGSGVRVTLPFLPTQTTAFARSATVDGSVIVGFCGRINGNFNDRACRWIGASEVRDLGTLPGGTRAQATAVSADGAVIVGTSGSPAGDRAFRWTAAGMISLGAIEPDGSSSGAAVNANGSVIVGSASFASTTHAFMWTQATGIVDLNTYLASRGLNLDGFVLLTASGVGADGMTIIGDAYHNGDHQGWIVSLHRPCTCPADFNCDSVVNSGDFFDFLASFFAAAPAADFNHDANVDSQDFFDFIAAFFTPCP